MYADDAGVAAIVVDSIAASISAWYLCCIWSSASSASMRGTCRIAPATLCSAFGDSRALSLKLLSGSTRLFHMLIGAGVCPPVDVSPEDAALKLAKESADVPECTEMTAPTRIVSSRRMLTASMTRIVDDHGYMHTPCPTCLLSRHHHNQSNHVTSTGEFRTEFLGVAMIVTRSLRHETIDRQMTMSSIALDPTSLANGDHG